VGKTTTVANVGAALARRGLRVVLADLDPQAHLTTHVGVEPDHIEKGSYAVLTQSVGFEDALLAVRENLWLLAANIDLVGAESELVSVPGRETILREAVEGIREGFDYLIVDCPPSLGLLTLNALAAVQEVLIPIQPHFLALQSFGQLLQTIMLVNRRVNPALKVAGVLLCIFDTRTSLSGEIKSDIEQFLRSSSTSDKPWSQATVIPVCVRRNIKLAEAPSYGKTIFEYDQSCHGAEDYALVAEYLHTGTVSGQTDRPVPAAELENPDTETQAADHIAAD
jgi:chromosome partitioning protein